MTLNQSNNVQGYAPLTIKANDKERILKLKVGDQTIVNIIQEMLDFIEINKELYNEYRRGKIQ